MAPVVGVPQINNDNTSSKLFPSSAIVSSTNIPSKHHFTSATPNNSVILKFFLKIFSILAVLTDGCCGDDDEHDTNNTSTTINDQNNNNNSQNKVGGSSKLHDKVKKFFQLSIICSTICIQLISFGLIMNDIEEYAPRVLFSWWRNKIS